jgi:asparagine synthase (glutamine-hydrolysing)
MCGIAGIVATSDLPPDTPHRVVAMQNTLVHRGPDEAGVYSDVHAILAHRRLSIIDLAAGQQPLSNEDGRIWVTYNGEIYNHAELRRPLEAAGHRFRTRSDTETIVHAYEEWGDACVEHFRGMFAFAVWDSANRRLLLVRDRLGVKPLYWCRVGDRLIFASEIKSILASGLVPPIPNDEALPEVLSTRYTSGPETLFKRINKLLPGHRLVFERGQVHQEKYWDLPLDGVAGGRSAESFTRPGGKSDAAVVERFRSLLTESVRLRLMSDVPLGVFLSGGIDSSAVAALMARQVDRPVQAFSVAFKERAYQELEHSRAIARAIGADAHEVVMDDVDFFTALPRLIWHEDEPIAHPSSVPLYFVAALARQHVKVVLTGEGSDELLAGYGKYPRTLWNWWAGTVYERAVPRAFRAALARHVVARLPARLGRYARRSFLAVDRSPEAMCFDNFAAIRLADQQRLLAPRLRELASMARAYGSSLAYFNAPNGHTTLLERLLYTDVKTYLVELLMKQDQMSMAASVESRVPFLDHRLVEFAARLPDGWKLSGGTTKRVLRDAMKGLVPDAILNRRKMGFPVPFALWTRGAWNAVAREVLLDRQTVERGIVDARSVRQLLDRHAAGTTEGGDRIWSLLNLELWFRTFIDQHGIQTLPIPVRVTHAITTPEPAKYGVTS